MHAEAKRPSRASAVTIPVEGLQPIEMEAALDGETVLIDVRPETDRLTEGIPGAIAASSQQLISWAQGTWKKSPFELERSRRIIVYSSDDLESRKAVEGLREMGFERAAYLIGGLDGWAGNQASNEASIDAKQI